MIETSNSVDSETRALDEAQESGAPSSIPPLELETVSISKTATSYELAELLQYHDRAFVICAYKALKKRPPSVAELTDTLNVLRSGRQTKVRIIERLAAGSSVRVVGLPPAWLRRSSGWPVIGYLLRLLSGMARLPVLMKNHQQFEVFALARQQKIADYLNEVVTPALKKAEEDSPVIAELSATVNDAVETVMILSDSLIEVSSQQADLEDQHKHLKENQEVRQQQLQPVLVTLTENISKQQSQLDDLRRDHDASTDAQRDFLVHEQRVIVETQKVAFSELQAQMEDLQKAYEEKLAELSAEVSRLRKLVSSQSEADPKPNQT